jgi:hypothetical protein
LSEGRVLGANNRIRLGSIGLGNRGDQIDLVIAEPPRSPNEFRQAGRGYAVRAASVASREGGRTGCVGQGRDEPILFVRATSGPAGPLAEALCDFCARGEKYATPLAGKAPVEVDLPGILRGFLPGVPTQEVPSPAALRNALRDDTIKERACGYPGGISYLPCLGPPDPGQRDR